MCSSLGLSYLELRASWTWLTVSFPMWGKFPAIISSNIFSGPLSLLSFRDHFNANVDAFNVVSEVSDTEVEAPIL